MFKLVVLEERESQLNEWGRVFKGREKFSLFIAALLLIIFALIGVIIWLSASVHLLHANRSTTSTLGDIITLTDLFQGNLKQNIGHPITINRIEKEISTTLLRNKEHGNEGSGHLCINLMKAILDST